ncbi:MAG: hypothetical protein K2K43_05050 [Alistipes sp.]|nr:hypothetical protein [Alistipes sp.]
MARNIRTELSRIAQILYSKKLCNNIFPIMNAVGMLKNSDTCKIEELKITLPYIPPNIIPYGLIQLEAVINITTDYNKTVNDIDIDNVFNTYAFQISFRGYGKGGKIYHSAIHLDYDPTNSSNYIHPWFHLTYGGHSIKNVAHGELMIMPVPRVPIWPMDFILGLDFVLSNFLSESDYKNWFVADSNYKAALRNSQKEIWQPYFLSMAHHWCTFANCQRNMVNSQLSINYMPTLIL